MGERLELEGAPVEIASRVGCSHTEYSVKGELAAVLRAVQGLFIEYAPEGYGTNVHHIFLDINGLYHARVSRMNSCD